MHKEFVEYGTIQEEEICSNKFEQRKNNIRKSIQEEILFWKIQERYLDQVQVRKRTKSWFR
jgi:hypothetical protein